MKVISVFSSIPNLLKELKRALPTVQFYEVSSEKDDQLKSTEVLIGDPELFGPFLYDLPKIKWIQSTWAGVDKFIPYIQPQKPFPCLFTRFSGEHFGRIMGEYVIASIVNHERKMTNVNTNQKSKIWTQEGQIANYRIISDLNIGILGIGAIGNRVAKLLHMLGATIYGYGRREKLEKTADTEHYSEYYTQDTITNFLKNCDYIVNILPSTSETRGLLNGHILEVCKERKPVFINIGRGSIINDEDLVNILNKGWISAAILDVFNTEPLPQNSPLWDMPQVTITPHCSGMSRAKDIAEQFSEYYKLYEENKTIPTTLKIEVGY